MQSYFSFLVTGCRRWPFYLLSFGLFFFEIGGTSSPASLRSRLSCLAHGVSTFSHSHCSCKICSLFWSGVPFHASGLTCAAVACSKLHCRLYHSSLCSADIFLFLGLPLPLFSSMVFGFSFLRYGFLSAIILSPLALFVNPHIDVLRGCNPSSSLHLLFSSTSSGQNR